jgi:hypothetical protein
VPDSKHMGISDRKGAIQPRFPSLVRHSTPSGESLNPSGGSECSGSGSGSGSGRAAGPTCAAGEPRPAPSRSYVVHPVPLADMMPAACQGIVGIMARADDLPLLALLGLPLLPSSPLLPAGAWQGDSGSEGDCADPSQQVTPPAVLPDQDPTGGWISRAMDHQPIVKGSAAPPVCDFSALLQATAERAALAQLMHAPAAAREAGGPTATAPGTWASSDATGHGNTATLAMPQHAVAMIATHQARHPGSGRPLHGSGSGDRDRAGWGSLRLDGLIAALDGSWVHRVSDVEEALGSTGLPTGSGVTPEHTALAAAAALGTRVGLALRRVSEAG